MEAVELYREESKKLEEHRDACEAAGKEVWCFPEKSTLKFHSEIKLNIGYKFSFILHIIKTGTWKYHKRWILI